MPDPFYGAQIAYAVMVQLVPLFEKPAAEFPAVTVQVLDDDG